jgi:hypothetical protein
LVFASRDNYNHERKKGKTQRAKDRSKLHWLDCSACQPAAKTREGEIRSCASVCFGWFFFFASNFLFFFSVGARVTQEATPAVYFLGSAVNVVPPQTYYYNNEASFLVPKFDFGRGSIGSPTCRFASHQGTQRMREVFCGFDFIFQRRERF